MKGNKTHQCVVCNRESPAYKCLCLARYCCVACFKTHKESCEISSLKKNANPAKDDVEGVVVDVERKRGRQYEVEREELHYKVTDEMLEKLMESDVVKCIQRELQKDGDDGKVEERKHIENIEEASIASSIASTIRSIGKIKSLKTKRKKLMMYMDGDEKFSSFCDSVLKEIGGRDEEGKYNL